MNTLSRREFLHRLYILGLGLTFYKPAKLLSNPLKPYYPPILTGIRGSHESAYKYAHQMAFEHKPFKADKISNEVYDLIVVRTGISGLSAAYFYLENINKNAKILILDNHDDFGGHAKRNEFHIKGQTLLSYGGTQSFDTVSEYSNTAKKLLENLGIKLKKFEHFYDKTFFEKYDLTSGIFSPRGVYEKSKLVQSALPANIEFKQFSNAYMPYLKEPQSFEKAI